ncbi:hypothetical protein [Pyxidicoccus sp. MSG2]|uniref:hypothetical protein n=1 Tax=Pyxidicoccus sp. MSG2 TaxID=2996790 RepID=UPI002270C0E5|nr:hypothetical protein [Pyxidicoccus sp. MSG2]MCY1017185.1 hypothetical protein [Pyxidicoccus sp. MSG2]
MRTPAFPRFAVGFHVLALVFFGGCAAGLVRESQALGGRRGMIDLGVAVAAVGLALLSLHGAWMLSRARVLRVLDAHARVGTYVQVLMAMGVLGLLGLHLLYTEGRPALGTFCLGLAAWLGGIGLRVVPALFLGGDSFIDPLGRRTRFSELEWFSLRKQEGEPPRVLLHAGRGMVLRLEARLADADAGTVRGTLLQVGLASRPGRP